MQMRREITIDSGSFSTLIPPWRLAGMTSSRLPTTVTERAEKMLFTAGYIWTAYQFGSRRTAHQLRVGRT